MSYYKSAYYTYQPTTTHSTYYNSWLQKQDYQTQQRGYGSSRAQDHRRHPPPSLTSGFSQSSFDSPSSYLSTPKELFGYEKGTNKHTSGGAGADAGNASKQGNEQQTGESISGMLSNFSKALGKLFQISYNYHLHFSYMFILY